MGVEMGVECSNTSFAGRSYDFRPMTMITHMKLSFLLFRFSRAFSVMFCGWIEAPVIIFGRGVEYVVCFLKVFSIVPHARNPRQK